MSSRLVVNSIRHSGASVDGITLDNSGNFSNKLSKGYGTDWKSILYTLPESIGFN